MTDIDLDKNRYLDKAREIAGRLTDRESAAFIVITLLYSSELQQLKELLQADTTSDPKSKYDMMVGVSMAEIFLQTYLTIVQNKGR